MASSLPETIVIAKTIPHNIDESAIGGDSYVDDEGGWVVELQIWDGGPGRLVKVSQGETVEFAGATWTVSNVVEPTTNTRGEVATLTRVG